MDKNIDILSEKQLETVCRCPLFAGIEPAQTAALLQGRSELITVPRGKPVTGYRGKLGILLDGRLLVTGSSGTPLNHLEPASLFGVSTVFTEQKAHVTDIAAEESSHILLLDERQLQQIFSENFAVNRNYLSFLTGRIRFLNWKIDLFSASTAEQKLLCWIRHQCRPEDGQLVVEVASMSRLAELLGMGRASLYRAVDALTEQGVLQKVTRKKWILYLGNEE
jgi:CRP-like cAMP-binding protein